jgi:methyl-accepting chemotaxis protein
MSSATAQAGPRRRRFVDLGVSVKILATIMIGLLVALTVGVVGLQGLGRTSAVANKIYAMNVSGAFQIAEVRKSFLLTRIDVANHALSVDKATMAKYRASMDQDILALDRALEAYATTQDVARRQAVAEIRTRWQEYLAVVKGIMIPLSEHHDIVGWQRARDTELAPLIGGLLSVIEAAVATERADAAHSAAQARADYRSSRTETIVLLVAGFLFAMVVGRLIARAIVRGVSRVRDVCVAMAAGDLTRVAGVTSRDEVGEMGSALDSALVRIRATVATIDGSAAALATAAEQMSNIATQIASSAEESSAQAQAAASSSQQVSGSVETVAAASEEMSASISEISRSANEAVRVVSEAVEIAASTTETVGKLGESSSEIGKVIKVITAIAEQTHLLALNATIEAARAGAAGKGFAVVASEVKELAQETSRATEDISRRVEAIQVDTAGAVVSIGAVAAVIQAISGFQTTIAAAVEEQTATTGEINRNVSMASEGTREIASNIGGVAEAAQLTSRGVSEAEQAATELARMSTGLADLVQQFRY